MEGNSVAVTTFESGPVRCDVRADETRNLYVGRIEREGEKLGMIAADTLGGLRAKFEAWQATGSS